MKIKLSNPLCLLCSLVMAAMTASAGLFHSKDKSGQVILQEKVAELEKQTQGLQGQIKQLEAMIASLKAQASHRALLSSSDQQLPSGGSAMPATLDELAFMSGRVGNHEAAVDAATSAEGGVPETESGLYGKITSLIARKDYKKAQQYAGNYMQSFAKEQNASSVLFWLGEIKMLFGELADAKMYYLQSLDRLKGKGRTPEILLKIAVIAYQKGEVVEGDKYYNQLQKIYPGSTASHMARAQRKKYRTTTGE